LNPPQKEAVEHRGGPLLVLAGAGSGKTRVLTRRVAHLIGVQGAFPGSILAVTFTNKAAGEMKERIVSLVGAAGKNCWTGTFHSIGARLLRREAERLGLSRDFTIFDRDDSLSSLRRVLNALGISPKETSPESLLSVISRAKNDMMSPADYERESDGPYERLVAQVYSRYEAALREQNALDFDDLLVQPVRLLRDEDVRQQYAHRFKHVLVDEYQDTNKCQYEFLHALTVDHRQLFVVGDDDQSIYRWRGADLNNILDFERDHPDAKVVRLEQNYRSTSMILGAANSVIRRNIGRKGKELWTENGDGHPVLVMDVQNEQAEALAVLKMIKGCMQEENRTASEFVVLYRTNSQSRVLETTFQQGGVPYQLVGGVRFYERREIKDVLAYLRLLVNPADDTAARRVINVPARGIGKKSLEDLQEFARVHEISLLQAMRRTAEGHGAAIRAAAADKLRGFFLILDGAAARMATSPVAEVTEQILQDTDYEQHLEKENERDAATRWENVLEVLSAMQEFADTPEREDASVAGFLQEVTLATDLDNYEETAPRVTLMTLHNAKGLEFPWVFITGVEEGLFPHANSANEPDGLEEERRLFYVGLTRARERVALFTAAERRRFGGINACMPSQFLDEIDPDFVERKSLAPDYSRGRTGGAYRNYGPGRGAGSGGRSGGSGRAGGSHDEWRGRQPARTVRPSRVDDTPDFIPSYEDESQDGVTVRPGMRVRHPSWGEGVVDAVEGRGEGLKLTIKFRGGVLKKVLAIYAKLELLG
ncbi:MAG: UvrD-helicase domain-containing protein, partial [Gemmatimonadetes bacterium]|nr:UvrD-helicase domain-containing protein [Gemmatimonadota bacterium]